MLRAAARALAQILSPSFRAVLLKSAGAALALLIVVGVALQRLFAAALERGVAWIEAYLDGAYRWAVDLLELALTVLASLGLVAGMVFLMPAVTALVAGFFADEIAAAVEREHYPCDPPGADLPVISTLFEGGRAALLALAVYVCAAPFLLVGGLGAVVFFLATAFLLGREYFDLAAMRFRSPAEAKALRRRHAGQVFFAGLVIAAFATIPLVNLATPLFGAAFMVHMHKRLSESQRPLSLKRCASRETGMILGRRMLTALAAAAALVCSGAEGGAMDALASIPPNLDAPAKELFGARSLPADAMSPRAIGFYAKGCLAGAVALPVDGPTWQVMRLSRNRNWGHPDLIALLERLANKVPEVAGWPGLLIGDIAQPRGGPMLTGHASHQVGLDADVWLSPMPDRILTPQEREDMPPTSVVAPDGKDVDPAVWTSGHGAVIKAAAEEPEVERIFVNAAIKKALCREAAGDRSWLHKVRPYYGHHSHFHIRIRCPKDSPGCTSQPEPPPGDGCGPELDWWFSDAVLHPKPKPKGPERPVKLSDLPSECRQVLIAP